LCFDGTWDSADIAQNVTNVVKLYRSVLGVDTTGLGGDSEITPKMETVKWYDPGVGTRWGERVAGGVFGYGLSRNIREGYKFLIDNYQPGDEIYIFGFSRGAYTARSLAGLMRNVGLVKQEFAPEPKADDNEVIVDGYHIYRERDEGPDSLAALEFRAEYCWDEIKIKFIGVWDTVGALGIPISALSGLNEAYAFHDERLSRLIENAFHAVAIDEQRKEYAPRCGTLSPKTVRGWSRSGSSAHTQMLGVAHTRPGFRTSPCGGCSKKRNWVRMAWRSIRA
jgi:uncharacterized protein (DUF2235 family)